MTRRSDAAPRQLGAAAAATGAPYADCPYQPDTPESAEWRLGYRQGADALAFSSSPRGLDIERVGGVDIAKHRDDVGPPELRQHVEITTSEVREGGESRRRPRTVDLARKMRRSGAITFEQEMAWRRFNRDFHIASFDELRAPDAGRTPVSGSQGGVSDHVEDAKQRVAEAMRVLGGHGSPSGNAAWYVFGLEWTILDFAKNQVYAHGASVRPEVARGVVIGTISALEAFYAEQDRDKDD